MKNLSLLSIFVLVVVIGCAFGRDDNCSSDRIDACTRANDRCIEVATSDSDSCLCLTEYGNCLHNIGCESDSDDRGDGSERGNAHGEFRSIVAGCNLYSCGSGGVCSIDLPSSAVTVAKNLGIVFTAATALMAFA